MKNDTHNISFPSFLVSFQYRLKYHLTDAQLFLLFLELQHLAQSLQETSAGGKGTFSGLGISLMETVCGICDLEIFLYETLALQKDEMEISQSDGMGTFQGDGMETFQGDGWETFQGDGMETFQGDEMETFQNGGIETCQNEVGTFVSEGLNSQFQLELQQLLRPLLQLFELGTYGTFSLAVRWKDMLIKSKVMTK